MKKIRLFVSQPFHGRTEKEIFEERETIVHFMNELFPGNEYEVIDQYHQEKPDGEGRLWHLSQDILMMEKADMVVFAPGWEKAKGCRVEHEVAEGYGLKYVEFDKWYNLGVHLEVCDI